MPGEKRLQGFLGCLLRMEGDILDKWRVCPHLVFSGSQVLGRFCEPRAHFREQRWVMRHGGVFPRE
jgi:hypothetical protein